MRAFGSRAVGKAKPTSDLDLCIMGKTPLAPGVVERLRRAFSDSSIPYKIDVVEWAGLSDAFRAIIEQTSHRCERVGRRGSARLVTPQDMDG